MTPKRGKYQRRNLTEEFPFHSFEIAQVVRAAILSARSKTREKCISIETICQCQSGFWANQKNQISTFSCSLFAVCCLFLRAYLCNVVCTHWAHRTIIELIHLRREWQWIRAHAGAPCTKETGQKWFERLSTQLEKMQETKIKTLMKSGRACSRETPDERTPQ